MSSDKENDDGNQMNGLDFPSNDELNFSGIEPSKHREEISDGDNSIEKLIADENSKDNQNVSDMMNENHQDDEIGLPSSIFYNDSAEILKDLPPEQPVNSNLNDQNVQNNNNESHVAFEQPVDYNNNTNNNNGDDEIGLPSSLMVDSSEFTRNYSNYDNQAIEEDEEDISQENDIQDNHDTKEDAKKKEKQDNFTKSYKEFLERNNHSAKRHADPSVPRLSSPVSYKTHSMKEPVHNDLPPIQCHNRRLVELYEDGCSPKKPNENTPNGASRSQSTLSARSSPMSSASSILANERNERYIDLIIGKNMNTNESHYKRLLKKFNINSEEIIEKLKNKCSAGDNLYNTHALKCIIKDAASGTGDSEITKDIRDSVRIALLNMKSPIMSPLGLKKRAKTNFDETLKLSLNSNRSPTKKF